MMKNVKYVGMEEGRECYEITIRKGHEKEAIAEMVKIQESENGKRRFYVAFKGISQKEAEQIVLILQLQNQYRNSYIRKQFQVNYSKAILVRNA